MFVAASFNVKISRTSVFIPCKLKYISQMCKCLCNMTIQYSKCVIGKINSIYVAYFWPMIDLSVSQIRFT